MCELPLRHAGGGNGTLDSSDSLGGGVSAEKQMILYQELAAHDAPRLVLAQDIGLKIGVGLTNVIWLVNPDRIVIGGGVAQAGERLFGYIRQTIRTRCDKTFWEKLEIVPATLGNDAGIIGAATLALESEFRPR